MHAKCTGNLYSDCDQQKQCQVTQCMRHRVWCYNSQETLHCTVQLDGFDLQLERHCMQTLFQTIVCGLQEWSLSVNLKVMPYHSALVWYQETRMLCSQISICQNGLYVIISYADCTHDHSARIRYKLYKESQCVLTISKKLGPHNCSQTLLSVSPK